MKTSESLDPGLLATPSFAEMRDAARFMWGTALVFLVLFAVSLVLSQVDNRLIFGASVWAKPAKFFLSLSLHLATVTAALLLLPRPIRNGWQVSAACGVITSMAIMEMIYICFRAARGEASHFNTSSTLAEALYAVMGMGAAMIMLGTGFIGVSVLRHGARTLFVRSAGWSFVLSAVLTLWIGFTLGAMGTHWIGGDQTDATGLPLLGWSTTGGDLRPAHFLALHAMQVIPFSALAGRRSLVWATAVLMTAATAATYALALSGVPLFVWR